MPRGYVDNADIFNHMTPNIVLPYHLYVHSYYLDYFVETFYVHKVLEYFQIIYLVFKLI